jgi:hypothetical protein
MGHIGRENKIKPLTEGGPKPAQKSHREKNANNP